MKIHVIEDSPDKPSRVIITPEGSDRKDARSPLAVTFTQGVPNVALMTNCRGDSSANLLGIAAIRHVHAALGEALKQLDIQQPVESR